MFWMVTARNVLGYTISSWPRFITHTQLFSLSQSIFLFSLSSDLSFLLLTLSSLTVSPSPPFCLFPLSFHLQTLLHSAYISTLICAFYHRPVVYAVLHSRAHTNVCMDRSNRSGLPSSAGCHSGINQWHTHPRRKESNSPCSHAVSCPHFFCVHQSSTTSSPYSGEGAEYKSNRENHPGASVESIAMKSHVNFCSAQATVWRRRRWMRGGILPVSNTFLPYSF